MSSDGKPVDPETLRVEHVAEGARVIGDTDWVATFADATEAARYITRCLTLGYWPAGRRIGTDRSADKAREELAAILRELHPPVEGFVAGCNCADCEAKRGK